MTYVGRFSSESVTSAVVRGDIHCAANFNTMSAVITIDHKGLVKTGERDTYNAKIEGKDGVISKMELLLPGKQKVIYDIKENKDDTVQGSYISSDPDDKGIFYMRKISNNMLPVPTLAEEKGCTIS